MGNIENARITSTMLGKEDHGIMTFDIFLDFGNGQCGFGGYALDGWDDKKNKRVASGVGLQAIIEILDVVGVSKWEELPGKYVRCESEGWGGRVLSIGNIIKDKWFNIGEFFKKSKEDL